MSGFITFFIVCECVCVVVVGGVGAGLGRECREVQKL